MEQESLRINRFLARSGVASRRGAEDLVRAGRVTVNGEVETDLSRRINPLEDEVCVDGNPIQLGQDEVVIMLNKPASYLTTMQDPFDRPTVADLLPLDRYTGLFPIGRLDFDTTGLLLFSTNGELGNKLLHPSHHVDKTYRVVVDGKISEDDLEQLRNGIKLDDGLTAPAQARLVGYDNKKHTSELLLTIHEGKKRQVKRMCSAVGHPVLSLERIAFGPLVLGDLPEGQWRELTSEEYAQLCRACGVR